MTKSKPCNALIKLIDTNIIELKITEWVERTAKHSDNQNPDDQNSDDQTSDDQNL
jgi:hypothetical protein